MLKMTPSFLQVKFSSGAKIISNLEQSLSRDFPGKVFKKQLELIQGFGSHWLPFLQHPKYKSPMDLSLLTLFGILQTSEFSFRFTKRSLFGYLFPLTDLKKNSIYGWRYSNFKICKINGTLCIYKNPWSNDIFLWN